MKAILRITLSVLLLATAAFSLPVSADVITDQEATYKLVATTPTSTTAEVVELNLPTGQAGANDIPNTLLAQVDAGDSVVTPPAGDTPADEAALQAERDSLIRATVEAFIEGMNSFPRDDTSTGSVVAWVISTVLGSLLVLVLGWLAFFRKRSSDGW